MLITRPVAALLAWHNLMHGRASPATLISAHELSKVQKDYKKAGGNVCRWGKLMERDEMEGNGPMHSRLFYHVLRVLAGMMTVIAGVVMSYACIAALFGEQELLIEFIDEDAASLTMNVPTVLAIVATNILAVTSLATLFFSMNRFLKHATRGDLLVASARGSLKRLGVGMVMLYLTSRSLAVLIPLVGIPGFWSEYAVILPLLFVDLDFLYLLVGVVLLALGEALREGQAAKEEAKQYV